MLKVTTLVENTSSSPKYQSKHGLSLYIETSKHKILFDLGPNGLFAENADKMGIDISKVDIVVISHGHKDHGGGLKTFLALNATAKIYINRQAFEPHYIKVLGFPFSVGLDAKLQADNRIIFVDESMVIDDELMIFSGVKTERYRANSNRVLYAKENGKLIQDAFVHEQNLMITVEGENVLFTGCSHAGVVDIYIKAKSLTTRNIKTLIGGFHLYNPPTGRYESDELIDGIASALAMNNCDYYTCHCTGKRAFERMKRTLSDRLHYLSVGDFALLGGRDSCEGAGINNSSEEN